MASNKLIYRLIALILQDGNIFEWVCSCLNLSAQEIDQIRSWIPTGLTSVWVGSYYGANGKGFARPGIWLLHPADEAGRPVETFVDWLDHKFDEEWLPDKLEQLHTLIEKWQLYAEKHGYGFTFDDCLYQKSNGQWKVLIEHGGQHA